MWCRRRSSACSIPLLDRIFSASSCPLRLGQVCAGCDGGGVAAVLASGIGWLIWISEASLLMSIMSFCSESFGTSRTSLGSLAPADAATGFPSMRERLDKYKPAVRASMHLFLAALTWTVVGSLLLYFGVLWAMSSSSSYRVVAIALAATVGLAKARFVLWPSAGRIIERICIRGDGRCIGGFLSIYTWAFVALMAGLGRLLRGGILPRSIIGYVYTAIGLALLVASARLWRAWAQQGR